MTFRLAFITPVSLALALSGAIAGCSGGGPQTTGDVVPAAQTQPASGAMPLTMQDVTDSAASTTVNWPQPGLNAAHTADNAHETTLTTSNVASLTQLWSFATSGQVSAPVIVDNGVAYADSGDGYLYAINTSTGTLKWKFQVYIGNGWQDEPVFYGGKVFVACAVGGSSQQQGLCALNATNGNLAWSYYINCNCLPSAGMSTAPVVSGGTIVFGYGRGGSGTNAYVTALSTSSGATLWATSTGGQQFSNNAPAVSSGNVYIGISSALCEYQLSSGSEVRCYTTGDGTNMAAVGSGVVYVNTLNSGVFAFNTSTGAQIWQYTGSSTYGDGYDDPPALANGTVYVAGGGGHGLLYALNAQTGALKYTAGSSNGADATDSSPSIANGVVYVNCFDALCAFRATTGHLLFEGPNNDNGPYASPSIVNGAVYTVCGYNDVCAFGLPPSSARTK